MLLRILWKQRTWFLLALQLRGSVVLSVLPRTLFCAGFAAIVVGLHQTGNLVTFSGTASVIMNIVLGLLLVFRTNTAYERFWEGRRLWGTLINTVRNLARQIWAIVLEKEPQDRMAKQNTLYLLVAFAVATKLHLRQESVNEELKALLPASRFAKLTQMNNPPLEVAFWIEDYLQQQYHRQCVNVYQLTQMQQLLNGMVDCLGSCERILKTPIPLAYAIHLKQLLLIYCLLLPFQFVNDLNGWTILLVAIISFSLLGIEEIGIEIENPFGRDPNDLKLDAFCETMKRNIDDLITIEPISAIEASLQNHSSGLAPGDYSNSLYENQP
ncbi:bestrophin family protein [Egbenema bharatensis]|uniref:bestrophin family protein n=1 Tax=Egbenema bharatensis TaxID=3463334 RepID=UPI003A88F673